MNRIFLLLAIVWLPVKQLQAQCNPNDSVPFSVDSTHLTVWNGTKYIPFFVKGMNLGAAIPGKFPGELEVTKEQYVEWLVKMKEAGYNCVRLYTLHFPHFYQVLDSINDADPQHPMLIFQGIWLDEEIHDYHFDLYELTAVFEEEIRNNINCLHGNNFIPKRVGKAWGTYATDVSKWVLGYIAGREIFQDEVINSNINHAGNNSFYGARISLPNGTPAEVWAAARLNHLLTYEYQYYQTMRPVSFSSWPTLDPMKHPEEANRNEDTASISLASLDLSNAPAGYFASYHAYPYYPDFMSLDPKYVGFKDEIGQNSYLGYLTYLKKEYKKFPLIIGEYGVPSSWVSAHFAHSGMHHGGFDERQQGESNMRILRNIQASGCGGGMTFAWIDEWFKRTWIADPLDYNADSRILWHNLSSPEQNFGIIGFQKPANLQTWQNFSPGSSVTSIKAETNYDFFHLKLDLAKPMGLPDTIWVALDTYDASLGESVMPDGQTISNRAEFALRITNYSAELYVTNAYDLFGIWHLTTTPSQLFHSVATNGGGWNLVRMRNNSFYSDVQYIGSLQVNKGGLLPSSKDAVTIYDNHVDIRLPWNYLQFVAPDKMKVFHDYKNVAGPKDTTSNGISVTVLHDGFSLTPSTRFSWATWNTALDVQEYYKASYYIMKDQLPLFNSKAIARCDEYTIMNTSVPATINAMYGVLKNDFDLDGNPLEAVLTTNPKHGKVDLNKNGSFAYTPTPGYMGADFFTYQVYDGKSLSDPTTVYTNVRFGTGLNPVAVSKDLELTLYPNPTMGTFTVQCNEEMSEITIFNLAGEQIKSIMVHSNKEEIDLSQMGKGIYLVKTTIGDKSVLRKLSVIK